MHLIVDGMRIPCPASFMVQVQSIQIADLLLRNDLRHDSHVNQIDYHGASPLHYAVEDGNIALVKFLLDAGAHVDNPGCTFVFPVHVAAVNGDLVILKLLISRGANLNAGDADANTCIHLASIRGDLPCIELLVALGVDVNCNHARGETPAHLCAQAGFLQCLMALFRYHGPVELTRRNLARRTPVEEARMQSWRCGDKKKNNLAAVQGEHELGDGC